MKPSLIALFTLFAFIASSAKAGVVLDVDGDEVINGGKYHILPFRNVLGGGLILAKTGNETCPLSVKPYPLLTVHPHYGLPWTISSPVFTTFIPTNTVVNFFSVKGKVPRCVPLPSSWTIVEEEDWVNSVKISAYKNPVKGVFQIQKYTQTAYKIVFCPTNNADSCVDIGLGSNGLVINVENPLGLIFRKAESYEVSKQVINNVLEA